ncbi:hypothetical protein RJT34_16351 [Clitoria ternatea]|uniref:Uncharacterized protein n=1 Tax=Clitoria ternatea TaxID=43366 RepID=A0AAN9J711_CLITE
MDSSQGSILVGFVDNASIQRDASCFDGVPIYVKELVAGGFAGAVSKTSVVPLERVKILWQLVLRTGPFIDLLAGSTAGGSLVICTYPLDLARTKLAYEDGVSSLVNDVKSGMAEI